MYTLIQHIEYLMMRYDCVVVPGWGALVAQYSESFYNPSAGVVERPRRSLGFNADVDHNDGLLAQSIVRREGVDYESALRMIAEGVAVYKRQLADGYEVPLGRLGFFHSNEGRAEFIPFYHEMMVDNYFGLRSVSFRPLEEVLPEEPVLPKPTPRIFSRRVWKVAASVAALIGLSVLLTTPITVNHNQNLAGLNLPEMKTAAAVHAPVDWSDFEADLAVGLPTYELRTVAQPAAVEPENGLLLDDGGANLLIIASLSSQRQAEGYIAEHPDLGAHMRVQQSGPKLFLVYVARSGDYNRLLGIRSTLPARYAQSWILER